MDTEPGQTTTDEPGEESGQQDPSWLREIRKKAEAYEQVVPKLKRDFALLKVGLDMEDPKTELFVNGWKGDWDNVDEVKQAAEKYGLLRPADGAAEPEPDPVAVDAATLGRIQQAGQSVSPPATKSDAWKNAKTMDEFVALYQQAGGQVLTE